MFLLKIIFPLQDPIPIFTIVLFIILLAPILLRKLRIPSIIGLIIAGMAIGDHGFNLVARGSIDLFGKAGLLYIMFLAGLELDMAEFKKNTYKSLVFGFFTFAIPLSLGFALCYYILKFDPLASLLVSSMFATHTLVAYPLASRMGITRNEAVTITVGGTIITDTAVLLILAVIAGASQGTLNQEFWVRLSLSFLAFAFFILFGYPFIGRWFFKKIKDDKTTHFIFVLALVFLAAYLAQLAGVEGIIGAFLAGLALNQLIPHTSPLMNRVEFVGNAIFIPFFLISVGMIVDLRVLLKGPDALYIAAALTIMALMTKCLAAFFTQKICRYSADQRQLIFGLSTSHAAATIAVILIGYNAHIIDENVLNGTIVLILVTCLVGSFVTANAGRRIAMHETHKETEVVNLHERFLIPVNNLQHTEALIDLSVMIHDEREHNPVYLLHVAQDEEDLKEKLELTQKNMELAIKHASITETRGQLVNRIDLNMVNGLSRAIKELAISDLVIEWDDRNGSTTDFIFNRLFGTATNNILDSIWETVYICKLQQPLNTTQKIVLVLTRNAEYEIGFGHWVKKLSRLARQVNSKILVCSTPETYTSFQQEIKNTRSFVDTSFRPFEEVEDFLVLSREIKKDDLIIMVNARKGTISYHSYMDSIPAKLIRHFEFNSFLVVYPEQKQSDTESGMQSQDLALAPIQEQIDNLNKIGKAVKKIFKGGARE